MMCLIADALRPRAPPQGVKASCLRCLTAPGPLEGREDTKDRQREHGRGRGCCLQKATRQSCHQRQILGTRCKLKGM